MEKSPGIDDLMNLNLSNELSQSFQIISPRKGTACSFQSPPSSQQIECLGIERQGLPGGLRLRLHLPMQGIRG